MHTSILLSIKFSDPVYNHYCSKLVISSQYLAAIKLSVLVLILIKLWIFTCVLFWLFTSWVDKLVETYVFSILDLNSKESNNI